MEGARYAATLTEGWRYQRSSEPQTLPNRCSTIGPYAEAYEDSAWGTVSVPHDLTVAEMPMPQNEPQNGYLPRYNVWYRRWFHLDQDLEGKRIFLRFQSVSGQSRVYVNGRFRKANYGSHASFDVDITDLARFGPKPNLVAVYSDNLEAEFPWYSGCGILQDVLLIAANRVSFAEKSLHIQVMREQESDWRLDVCVDVTEPLEPNLWAEAVLLAEDGCVAASFRLETDPAVQSLHGTCLVSSPALWRVGAGKLYTLRLTLHCGEMVSDALETCVGFREAGFCADRGLLLNGEQTPVRGFCFHDDEGGLGTALTPEIYGRRLDCLLEMGANTYRVMGHGPAEALLEQCDRHGILVVAELPRFDCGEIAMEETAALVRSVRNHPCAVLYLVNDCGLAGTEGRRTAEKLRRVIHALDGTRPLCVELTRDYSAEGPGGAADMLGAADCVERLDSLHQTFPKHPVLVSQIGAISDLLIQPEIEKPYAELAWRQLHEAERRPFVCGTLARTGAEFRGESRNLTFFSDSAPLSCVGNPKDGFYAYRAHWSKEPVLHLCGHWSNRCQGEPTLVRVYTNLELVRFYLNGRLCAEARRADRPWVDVCLAYEPGELLAVGFLGDTAETKDWLDTAGEPAALQLMPQKQTLAADGKSLLKVDVMAVDGQGRRVPTSSQLFTAGCSSLLRVCFADNADPYCPMFPEAVTSCLYQGRGVIVLQSGRQSGDAVITASSPGLPEAACRIDLEPSPCIPNLPAADNPYLNGWFVTHVWDREPDIFQYTADTHYISWQPYPNMEYVQKKERPFYFRTGYVTYCNEPNAPVFPEGQQCALVFEQLCGKAKILVRARTYTNVFVKEYYQEKKTEDAMPLRLLLPGVTSGERLVVKVVLQSRNYDSGTLGPVRFEIR